MKVLIIRNNNKSQGTKVLHQFKFLRTHNRFRYLKFTQMKKIIIFSIFTLLFGNIAFSQYTVENVPDPKKDGNGFVSDPDNIIGYKNIEIIDSLIREVQDSSKAEIAVVALQSIGDAVPKEFATKLFNFWHIGDAKTDNGLLILLVLDQRRVEFETGYGTELVLPDAKCYEIQQVFMVPLFKEDKYGEGIVAGVKASADILLDKSNDIYFDKHPETTKSISNITLENDNYYENNFAENNELLMFYLSFSASAVLIFLILLTIALFSKDFFVRYQLLRVFRLYIWFILVPIPFVGIYFLVKNFTDKWRNTPRISAKTGKVMHKLSEKDDDKYLEKGQVKEEEIKSVDYDVWVSGVEGDILIQKYKRWFSKYNACPKCKYKTYHKVYDKVIVAATYTTSGKGEKFFKCENCGHSKIVVYTIPKKTKTSSTSSGSSSWSGGSSSWSSGGGSWGGGSSGGGGAGSSW